MTDAPPTVLPADLQPGQRFLDRSPGQEGREVTVASIRPFTVRAEWADEEYRGIEVVAVEGEPVRLDPNFAVLLVEE